MRWTDFVPFGSKRSMTKEGFMLCRDVPVARCGVQHYGPGETPVMGDFVSIERNEDEVFHPEAISSCWGKPVCVDHPMGWDGGRIDIDPSNWRDLTCGTMINPHRSADEPDLLCADLMIYDPTAIKTIEGGKRQISLGYDADYEELGPGHGRQHNIRVNHCAIVDMGRCGIRCSIGDSCPNCGGKNFHRPRPRVVIHGRLWVA